MHLVQAQRQRAAVAALLVLVVLWILFLVHSQQGYLNDEPDERSSPWGFLLSVQSRQGLHTGESDEQSLINPNSSLAAPIPELSGPTQPSDDAQLLILYAYKESETARENIQFFLNQGLHGSATFVFILNGETDIADLIPARPNIRVVQRQNTCFDLGAYGEVLRQDGLHTQYKRFIMLNASIRGPFLPYWSRDCWSDLYTSRLNSNVKLVGMTANCWPQFHVQSMIWATDDIGIRLLLSPPPGSSRKDQFGEAEDDVGLAGCYDGWNKAVHAEVGSTALFLEQGYEVDLMMAAFHKSPNYIEECDTSANGDFLANGKYFGSNVHPYETVFIKANRDIDPNLLNHLTDWHLARGTTGWDTCGGE